MKALTAAFALLCLALPCGPAASAELQPFTSDSFAAILKAHAGRPAIIHFWGLTCGPCRAEMAAWGEFASSRKDFDFISIDTDLVAGPSQQAEAFLTKSGIPETAEAWRFASDFAEKLYFRVDPAWQGEIPMTIFVARNGAIKRVTGAVDFAEARDWIDQQNAVR